MKSNIKVSIIIPIYNVEEYLEECLVSAVKQTLNDIEIICVNDGSLDNSMEIVKRYAEKDERIVIVNKENGGLSSARNAGLDVASGEYVYFLDSDDYIVEDAMEVLYDEAKLWKLDSIYFDAESFFDQDETREKVDNYDDYYIRKNNYSKVVSGLELLANMEENDEFRASACLQMNRTAFLKEKNIRFIEGIIHEDNPFTLECMMEAQRTKHILDVLYMRRLREDSIMTMLKEYKSSWGYFVCIREIAKKLEENECDEAYRQVLIKRLVRLQTSAFNKIKGLSDEELDEFLSTLSPYDELEYSLIIKTSARERAKVDRLVREKARFRDRCVELKEKNHRLKERNKDLKGKADKYKKTSKDLKERVRKLEQEQKELLNSNSYKVGKILMFIPGKIKKFVKKLKQKGIKGVCRAIKYRIVGKPIKISVIMPVYNAEKYLEKCLRTVREQSLKDIEIICVNDGSTDSSLNILKKVAKEDQRVKIIDKKNSGAGDCRNAGMKIAKGKYLLFLDSDDFFAKRMCELAYERIEKDNADICFFGARRYNMQTKKYENMPWVLRPELLPEHRPFEREDLGNKFFQMTSGAPWSKLFRREFVQKHKLQFQNLKNANDLYFVRSAMALADKMTYVNKHMVNYRFAAGDSTQAKKHKAPLEFYKAYKAVRAKLIEEGVYEDVKQSFDNMAFDDCLFNYRTTTTPEAKELIFKTLREEGVEYFEFEKRPADYYFNQTNYKEFFELLKISN